MGEYMVDKDRRVGGATYVLRALPGPGYRLTGPLARAQARDRKRIAVLKSQSRAGSDSSTKSNSAS